jgi:hypothetical protein
MSKKNAADIQIDHLHSRAICDEIGERLRQAIRQESVGLPPRLQLLVDRLAEFDGAAALDRTVFRRYASAARTSFLSGVMATASGGFRRPNRRD